MKVIGILAAAAGVALLALSGHGAVSQTARTIRIVVPFPAGGSADDLARLLADQVGRTRGVNFVIENRPGAGTVVATEAVSRAAPDGNTLLIVANSFVINPSLKKLNYDPFTSFAPVCHLVSSPLIVAVNSDSPYRSLADLIKAARAKPGELTMASVAPATTQHIAFEMFKRVADVNMIHVPYPGGAPAVTALLGGHVTAVIANYSEVEAHLAAGKLRALATASRQRIGAAPDLPTVAESGYSNYESEVWFGLVAPAKTPADTITQLSGWLGAALATAAVKEKLQLQEMYPVGACGADFAAHLRTQFDAYARVIREADIKAE
ncbi:MAG TPA: tripartite tricarboxylate transporter substrate binding protein [Xanthobacteraceae bacterium]|jgi:tripartite-type tricarboxylate transporter receptor subunit TctC